MRGVVLTLLLLPAWTACGADAAPPKPLGAFVLDAEAMTQALIDQGMAEAAARRNAAAGRVRLAFDPAGTFTLVVRAEAARVERSSGGWSRAGNTLTLVTTVRGGKPLDPPQTVVAHLSGERLAFDREGPGTLPFLLRSE